MIWVLISLFCAVAIGLVGRAITASAPLVGPDSEKVFLVMSREIFPAFMAGVVMSAVLAAIMSTADSQLLVASSAISEDFYKSVFRGPRSARKSMFIGRISVLVIAIAAFIFALNPDSSVFKVVSFAWSGLGATFGPVIILSLFWRRMTGSGALAGIVAGGVTVLVWHNLAHFGGIFKLYEIVPGFAVSVLAIVITSLVSKAPSGAITRQFNEVAKLSR
jgi:sodium/proline symporter